MIIYRYGSIFDSPDQTIVNPVNCVGVMGKGLALQFKQRYPEMFDCYWKDCADGVYVIGDVHLHKLWKPWILNFPTKVAPRDRSYQIYIDAGLRRFVQVYKDMGIESISFPKLGCGEGRLLWDDIGPLMAFHLDSLPIDVSVYIVREDSKYHR